MKPENILKTDMLDVLFENRNQQYGAYNLRKFYNERLFKAFGITFLAVGLLVVFSFTTREEKPPVPVIFDTLPASLPVTEPDKPLEPKKEVPKSAAAKQVDTKVLTSQIDVVKDQSKVDKIENLDSSAVGSKRIIGETPQTYIVPDPIPDPGPGPGIADVPAPKVDKVTPMDVAEVMPAYPGGMEALRKFLQKNLNNPEAMEEGQEVSVKMKFVVGYDGVLKSFETVQDGGSVFNKEVMRVLKKMPAWIPGKSQGENVSVYYTIPVKFTAAE